MAATLVGMVLIIMMLLRGADPMQKTTRLSIFSSASGLFVVGKYVADKHGWAEFVFAAGCAGLMIAAAIDQFKSHPRTTI